MQEAITLAVKTSLLNDNEKHLVRDSENQLTGEMARELKYGGQTLLYSGIQNQAFFKSKKQKCHVHQIKETIFLSIRLTLQIIKDLQFLLKQNGT